MIGLVDAGPLKILDVGGRVLAENARDISDSAAELYKRLAKFGEHFQKVGRGLTTAIGSYNDAVGSMERQVLQMVGEGKSTKDVAKMLGISAKTAESHRARLMQKLDIHETASLVRYAIRRGLVQP